MKVILYMAISLDGFIARDNGFTSWTKEEWAEFTDFIREKKNIIIGRKAYEIMLRENEFDSIGKPFTVVVSRKEGKDVNNVKFVKSPREAIILLREQGFSEIVLAGGGEINGSFLREKLIDEIILDVESVVFGSGKKLFGEEECEVKLDLIESRKISNKVIQLRYRVKY